MKTKINCGIGCTKYTKKRTNCLVSFFNLKSFNFSFRSLLQNGHIQRRRKRKTNRISVVAHNWPISVLVYQLLRPSKDLQVHSYACLLFLLSSSLKRLILLILKHNDVLISLMPYQAGMYYFSHLL
jgi:hypothetical protein